MAEVVQMSLKESDRYAVMVQVIARTMGQSDAASWLDISVLPQSNVWHAPFVKTVPRALFPSAGGCPATGA